MESRYRKRARWKFFLKVDIPAFIAFSLFAGLIFFYLIPGFEKTMMDRKRVLIQEITSSAYSLLEYYHSLEKEGSIDSAAAKKEALSAISRIRYGNMQKDYLWITDMHPNMIVHPYRPDLNGKDLTQFRDPMGKLVFVEFVKAVQSTGESYVDYMWQWNDDSTRIVPKLSYVRLFKPWGWIIGTGIYIDDVRQEIRKMEFKALIISGLIAVVIIILLIVISRQSHRTEKLRNKAENDLRRSRELYRTLAEASSEGVILWSASGMQANKTLLSWLGYNESEFDGLKAENVLSGTEILSGKDPESIFDTLTARHYARCTLKTKDNNELVVHSDFSRIMLGDLKAVLVSMKPATRDIEGPVKAMTIPLINIMAEGVFKATYGRKSRFLFANEAVLRILGFSSLQELELRYVDTFFADPFELKAFRSALERKEEIINRAVLLKRKDLSEFRALVSIIVAESDSGEIWYEGIIEELAVHFDNNNSLLVNLGNINGSLQQVMIPGMVSAGEMAETFFRAPELLAGELKNASTGEMLRNIYLSGRRLVMSMIAGQADPYSVSLYISSLADAICRRAVELYITEAGDPPCRFVFLQTGSAGRREQTLSTDQDNAIVYDNVEAEKKESAGKYFLMMGKRVNELLSEAGYRYCKGDKMAGNTLWCQPLEKWKEYFSGWIKNPGPSELLEMSIFFDFRMCFGNTELADKLREYVSNDLKANDIYFHHMAAAWKSFTPALNIRSDKKTDIKKLIMPMTGLIRLYALKYGITGFSSLERIIELYSGNYFDHRLLRDLIKAWKDLTSIRLIHQVTCISSGTEPDNHVDLKSVSSEFVTYTEQAVTTINNLVLKASNDFYAELG